MLDRGADPELEIHCLEGTADDAYQNDAIEAVDKSLNDVVCQRTRGQVGMTEAGRGKSHGVTPRELAAMTGYAPIQR